MFTGWGIRTLSQHVPHVQPDELSQRLGLAARNAIAAVGMLRYGLAEPFFRLATGLFRAVYHFERSRMPELFCGFAQMFGHGPTRYPVACSPQAWSAGVVFQLVTGMLGPPARRDRKPSHAG